MVQKKKERPSWVPVPEFGSLSTGFPFKNPYVENSIWHHGENSEMEPDAGD